MKNHFIWADEQAESKNANYLFTFTVFREKTGFATIDISAGGSYKLYVDGVEHLSGPSRTAKGYFRPERVEKYLLAGWTYRFTIFVNDYGVNNFAHVFQPPFLYFKMQIDGETIGTEDFVCYRAPHRVQKTQRYSFQRGFAESYVQKENYREIFDNLDKTCVAVPTKAIAPLKELARGIEMPDFAIITAEKERCGTFERDENKPLWKDRSIYQVGNLFEGFYHNELEECLSDTIGKLVYKDGETREELSQGEFAFYRFPRNISGFVRLGVEVLEDAEVYLTFDESITDGFVNATRLDCCSIVKWQLAKGVYELESLEAYTLQFAQVIVLKGRVKPTEVAVRTFENPEPYNMQFSIADEKLSKILQAAQHTSAQNSVDLLMDCPSRERSGWINDIYFSMKSSEVFTGGYSVVKNSLENYALYGDEKQIPKGMLPMCYPASHVDRVFMPTCSLWYVINLCEFLLKNPKDALKRVGKKNAYRVLRYFEDFENEDGLLEDLDGAIFIEWSQANTREFVDGVNYPSNMLYYMALRLSAQVWNDDAFRRKSARVKRQIIKQSFNGRFFEDNRIREEGKLVLKGHMSEVCQYYAFLSGVATRKTFPALYATLRDELGPQRKQGALPEVAVPNIIPGLLARETILIRNGECDLVLDEVKDIFFVMAEHYQTLWEMVGSYASCNHGIASYAGYLIIRATTGFTGYQNGRPAFTNKHANVDCSFVFKSGNTRRKISVEKGKRTCALFTPKGDLDSYIEKNYTESVEMEDVPFDGLPKGIKALQYRVKDGKRAFAFIGYPDCAPPTDGYPAVVLVHGGGGRAYYEWIERWIAKGYVAIAPDFNGSKAVSLQARSVKNENGGPQGYGSYKQFYDEDNWTYFGVLEIMKAVDLLSADTRVDKNRIVIEGISWGGVLSLVAIAKEKRIKGAAIKYSSGYYDETLSRQPLRVMTDAERGFYWKRFDPRAYLAEIETPVFFAAGTNDHAFPMYARKRTSDGISAPTYFSLRKDFPHGHYVAWETDESIAFADSVLYAKALPNIRLEKGKDGVRAYADCPTQEIWFVWTCGDFRNTAVDYWYEKQIQQGELALLPENTTAYFVEIKTQDGLLFSTDVQLVTK